MSTAPRYIPRYTAEQYATWEGRWELLDGLGVDDRYESLAGAGPQSIDLCADCTISLDLSRI